VQESYELESKAKNSTKKYTQHNILRNS